MRKSDDEAKPGIAHIVNYQKEYLFDKIIIRLIYLSSICRALFSLGALLIGFDYAPSDGYGANTVETFIHLFLYDFNYTPFFNFLFSLGLLISAYTISKKIKQGFILYLLLHVGFILLALSELSESDMNYQSYYWILTGIWIILVLWRKRYIV